MARGFKGVFASTVLVLACGADPSGEWSGTIDTLLSGAIHVSNPERGLWGDAPPWQLEVVAKIGTRLDSGPEVFGDIADLDADAAGRVYLLDRQAQNVRVFNRDGSFVRTIGKVGGGPGEFRFANGIALDPAGRLWVHDQSNARYSVFDENGHLLMEPRLQVKGILFVEWYSAFSPDGVLYQRGGRRTSEGTEFGMFRYDTTAEELVDVNVYVARPASGNVRPFSNIFALTPKGRWSGNKYTYRLTHTTFSGEKIRLIDRARAPDRLSPSERDSAERHERQLKRRARQSSLDLETEHRPIFNSLALDDLDYLWVLLSAEPDADSTRFDVFDSIGRYLGQLSAPHVADWRVLPVIRDDRIHYVVKDELDVQYVVIADIRGRH